MDNLTPKQFKLLMVAICVVIVASFAIPFFQEKMGYSTKNLVDQKNNENSNDEINYGNLTMVASLFISVTYGIYKQNKK